MLNDHENSGIFGRDWDDYVKLWPIVRVSNSTKDLGGRHQWPGDEWHTPEVWEEIYKQLFVPFGVDKWQKVVEIGPGSGKYTLKVLGNPRVVIRAYDVSPKFIDICMKRCDTYIQDKRLDVHLLGISEPNQLLTDITAHGWRRDVDAFFSIDAMVHVNLQYLIVYLITAALSLKPQGKLILTLADATTELGFLKLLKDIAWSFRTQDGSLGAGQQFAWLSPDLIEMTLERLGFTVQVLNNDHRDLWIVSSLTDPSRAEQIAQQIGVFS